MIRISIAATICTVILGTGCGSGGTHASVGATEPSAAALAGALTTARQSDTAFIDAGDGCQNKTAMEWLDCMGTAPDRLNAAIDGVSTAVRRTLPKEEPPCSTRLIDLQVATQSVSYSLNAIVADIASGSITTFNTDLYSHDRTAWLLAARNAESACG